MSCCWPTDVTLDEERIRLAVEGSRKSRWRIQSRDLNGRTRQIQRNTNTCNPFSRLLSRLVFASSRGIDTVIMSSRPAIKTYGGKHKTQHLQVFHDPSDDDDSVDQTRERRNGGQKQSTGSARRGLGERDINALSPVAQHAEFPAKKSEAGIGHKRADSIGKENVAPPKSPVKKSKAARVRIIQSDNGSSKEDREETEEPLWTPSKQRTRRPRRAAQQKVNYAELDSPAPQPSAKTVLEEDLSVGIESLSVVDDSILSDASTSIAPDSPVLKPRRAGTYGKPAGGYIRSTLRRSVLADLSADSQQGDSSEVRSDALGNADAMMQLLASSGQLTPMPFDDCIDQLLASKAGWEVVKIGEATYSEVYRLQPQFVKPKGKSGRSKQATVHAETRVLKVLPLRSSDPWAYSSVNAAGENLPERTMIENGLKEVQITKAVGEIQTNAEQEHNGFVKLVNSFVTQGSYAEKLLEAWDNFDESVEEGSENRSPGEWRSMCVLACAED